MKNNYSKVFSTILITFFGIGLICILFFLFAHDPKSGQVHGIYGLIAVGVIFTILAIAGELSRKEPSESTGHSMIYKISLLYLVVMVLISLLYILRWAESLSWFYTFHISSFLFLSIALIAVSTSTGSVSEVSTKKVDLSTQVKELRSRLSILCLQYSDAPWHAKLFRCQEEMGIFNTDVTVPADLEIARLVGTLEKSLQKKKEQEEEVRLALEEEKERARKEDQEKLAISGGEASLEDTEEEDDSFTLVDEDEEEDPISEDEKEMSFNTDLWVIEEEDEDSSDIPSLVEELYHYIQQRPTEAKGKA